MQGKWRSKEGGMYLPKTEENNSFDAEKLREWLMWFQFFGKDMIEEDQGVHGQGN